MNTFASAQSDARVQQGAGAPKRGNPEPFRHRVPVILMGTLILLSLALATSVTLGFFERQAIPSEARAASGAQVVESRSLLFFDEADGTVRIEDAFSGDVIDSYGPGTGGFVRSSVRSLVHKRRINGIGRETPFELIGWDNGDLTLMDSTTGQAVELASFGTGNRATFAAMLKGGAEQ
ncbi:MAG: photosynthetic complex assembly protein PuhC [Pseudomonadota bacterium]